MMMCLMSKQRGKTQKKVKHRKKKKKKNGKNRIAGPKQLAFPGNEAGAVHLSLMAVGQLAALHGQRPFGFSLVGW